MPSRALVMRLEFFVAMILLRNLEAHRTGGTLDHAHRCVYVAGVQIFQLRFGDLTDLRTADLACNRLARRSATRLETNCLLEEVSHRRRLHREGEGLVLVVGDYNRDRRTLLEFLSLRVERLAEFHNIDAALTKRRTDRGRRRSLTRGNLKLELACNFLSHFSSACIRAGCCRRLQSGGRERMPPAKATRSSHRGYPGKPERLIRPFR